MSRRTPFAPLAVGLAAAVALALGAIVWPKAAAQGWLVAFLAWSSAPIGAIVLSLIHALTGGRWGDACRPTLRAGALGAALLPFFFLPVLASLGALYPWVRDAASLAPDVARDYLNAPSFAVRGLVALAGWAVVGLFVAAGRLSPLGAALALVFHGFAVSIVAVDWALSVAPHFTNSAFGATIAVQQIAAALAAVALLQPERAIARAGGDIGGLLFATSLGGLYLVLMTFIVKWYGDQAIDAAWFLSRARGPWLALLLAALTLGAATPILGLAWARMRTSAAALRVIGAATLAGIALRYVWLIGPTAAAGAAVAAAFALIAMGGLSLGLGPRLGSLAPETDAAAVTQGLADDR
jgi:hypothetical protein